MNLISPATVEALTEHVNYPLVWSWMTRFSEPFFVGLLIALFAVFLYRRTGAYWNVPAHVTLGLALAVPLNYLLRYLFQQPRPFMEGLFEPLVYHEANFGFPSNHAVATAVFTVVFLWFGYRSIGGAIAVITLFVGVGRVLTGLHYPVDIVAGWVVGGTIGSLVCYYKIARWTYVPKPLRQILSIEQSRTTSSETTENK